MKVVQKIEPELYDKILELMPILCVDIVIEYQGKVLLVKRKNHPAKGQWWFPGGRVFKGESIEQAAVRNGIEEVGLDCNVKKILGIEETYFERVEEMKFDIHTINVTVELDLIKYKEPAMDKDHSEYMWTNSNSKEFHPSIQNILKQYYNSYDFPNADVLHANGMYEGNNQFVNEGRLTYLHNLLDIFWRADKSDK